MTILVTGGCGYIGSHTILELKRAGHDVVVIDDLSNSTGESLTRIRGLLGDSVALVRGDVRDTSLLADVMTRYSVNGILHFAGMKSVPASFRDPLQFYNVNVGGTLSILSAMTMCGIKRLVFSSSATVYGSGNPSPLHEELPTTDCANPYGRTKLLSEKILLDAAGADRNLRIAILRYFNPIGADVSGQIGEDPLGDPTNLVPIICRVATGRYPVLEIFGTDYPTPDGTCMRDFIHITDLAIGHIKALDALDSLRGARVWNLGTGNPVSVLQLVEAFESIIGRKIPAITAPRREGDVAICYANPTRAREELNWNASRHLGDMVRDSWRWQVRHATNDESRRTGPSLTET